MILEDFSAVVMQPTTVCNLDCSYCYLPTRHLNLKMFPWVAENVAHAIAIQGSDRPVSVIWHGGEPMATGVSHFRKLLLPFEVLRQEGKVVHYIQTNATLIDGKWCDFFEEFEFRIGVSIDGPEWANLNRVGLDGKPSFRKTLKGIGTLNKRGIPFTAIAVVHTANIERTEEFYEFFQALGCYSLGINIEEQEGANTLGGQIDDGRVFDFWKRLYVAWQANPTIRLREFAMSMNYIEAVIEGQEPEEVFQIDPFPTVGWEGSVCLLSPEFAGVKAEAHNDFIVGSLVNEPLSAIIRAGRKAQYVVDFEAGVDACRNECPYFRFCGGGQASNKFFEHGTTNATETIYCRNSRKRLLEAVLDSV